jgi:hypothetical protein
VNREKECPTATGMNGEAPNQVNLAVPTIPGSESKLLDLKTACERGWEIFPTWWLNESGVCACDAGERCTRPGKHPRIKWQHPDPGRSGATSDFAQVQEWHSLWPEANWAMRLDDVFVVDVDKKHGGLETHAEYEENAPEYFPPTLTQRTSGGGLQLVYRQPAERDVHTIAQGRLPHMTGIEVKALRADGEKGSYCLIPPSQGREWLEGVNEVVDATPHLLKVIRGVKRPTSTVDGVMKVELFDWDRATEPGAVPPGEQDDTLHRAAASLRGQGVNDSTALAILRRVVDAFMNDPTREPWTHEHAERKWRETKERYPGGRTPVEIAPKLREWAEQARSHVDGRSADVERPFILSAAQVRSRPRLRWFVEDIMPERALFQIFGQTGTYKTFVIIDLLGQVANGPRGNFLGRQVLADGPGLACMVLGEGGGDIGERVEAWCQAHPELASENMFFVVDQDLDLLNNDHVNTLGENLVSVATERGLPWRMIIFDTQADHLPNGDERDEATFSRLKPVLLHISRQTGACVGLVHHTGWKDERERGSSRQRQMMDVVMEVRDLTLTSIKVKAGPKFDPIAFKTERVADSLVVRPASVDDLAELSRRSRERRQRETEALVRYLTNVTDSAKRSQAQIISALGVGKETFQELVVRLGPRVRTESGRRNATWYFLVDPVDPVDEPTSSGSERV